MNKHCIDSAIDELYEKHRAFDGEKLFAMIQAKRLDAQLQLAKDKRELQEGYVQAVMGLVMAGTPFMVDSLGAEITAIGLMMTTTSKPIGLAYQQLVELKKEITEDLSDFLSVKPKRQNCAEYWPIEGKEKVIETAIKKSMDLLKAGNNHQRKAFINARYNDMPMNETDRVFFDNAVKSIQNHFKSHLLGNDQNALKEMLRESKNGVIKNIRTFYKKNYDDDLKGVMNGRSN